MWRSATFAYIANACALYIVRHWGLISIIYVICVFEISFVANNKYIYSVQFVVCVQSGVSFFFGRFVRGRDRQASSDRDIKIRRDLID